MLTIKYETEIKGVVNGADVVQYTYKCTVNGYMTPVTIAGEESRVVIKSIDVIDADTGKMIDAEACEHIDQIIKDAEAAIRREGRKILARILERDASYYRR